MLNGFKEFILRGNVVDLAIGVVIGSAFGNVVSAIVKDLFTPFLGALIKIPDFSSLSFTVNGSKIFYGDFLNALFSFLFIATSVYVFVVLPMNTLTSIARRRRQEAAPKMQKCPECASEIPLEAKRCAHCAQPVV